MNISSLTATKNPDNEYITEFSGLDRNIRTLPGEFADMKNMSGDLYPLISVRGTRRGGAFGISGVTAAGYATSYGAQRGASLEESIVYVKDDNGAKLCIHRFDGTDINPMNIGGDAKYTQLVLQAGKAYTFGAVDGEPIGYMRNLMTGGEFKALGNFVKIWGDAGFIENNNSSAYLSFTMEPSDKDGKTDNYAGARLSTGQGGITIVTSGSRRSNYMCIVNSGSNLSVNEYGYTIKCTSGGIVKSMKYGVAETLSPTNGEFCVTGHGKASNWLGANVKVGDKITKNETGIVSISVTKNVTVYTKPSEGADNLRWRDNESGRLYIYSGATGQWVAQTQNYISFKYSKVGEFPGGYHQKKNGTDTEIGPFDGFAAGDTFEISNFDSSLDGSYYIEEVLENGLLLSGYLSKTKTTVIDCDESGAISFVRRLPKMDFVVEAGNRLWGCYFGEVGGKVVNEIYASALGDATNWYKYQNTSMDSWTATVGVDGVFTGAAVYGGYPIFFKEDAIIIIYGTSPSSFTIKTYNYRGVKRGSDKSIAIVDEVMYYHSNDGIVAYRGGVPEKVDRALGRETYRNAVGGTFEGKYYVSMENEAGEYELFVYNSRYNVWHKEDDAKVTQFLRVGARFYMIVDGDVVEVLKDGDTETEWFAESGDIGYETPYQKRLTKIKLRAILPIGCDMKVEVSYDGGKFETCCAYMGRGGEPFDISFIPHSCDTFRYRLSGRGDAKIISLYMEKEYA